MTAERAPMRLLIVDDHPLFRDGLRSLLEARGIDVVGEARNGREAVEQARRLHPDVVLMDLSMPEMSGLAATRLLSAEQPHVKVVILTASEDDGDLLEAIRAEPRATFSRTWIPRRSSSCWMEWRSVSRP
jgi:DNA-binding NarL/FixJ family response regulator